MSYKSQSQLDIESSPVYAVRHWRNVSQETIDSLDEFLAWLEFDDDSPDMSNEDFHDIELLVDQYLGRDEKKVAQGEKQLLDAWIKATEGAVK